MSRTYVPQTLRRHVVAEARGRCAYCHTLVAITGARFVIDHIVPEAAGGLTQYENLCLACHACNEFKGARIEAADPLTGELSRLFHFRQHRWRDHFLWNRNGVHIFGTTPVGRATVDALRMNHADIVAARQRWVSVGWHPPAEDF